MADDSQATLKSPTDELAKLSDQQKAAETKQKIAEAEKAETVAKKATREAQFPSGEAKPVEGKITTDDKAGYIATFAAYDALIKKADEIGWKISKLSLEKARILIVDSLDFAGSDVRLIQVLTHISFCDREIGAQLKKIGDFAEELDKMTKPAKPPEPAAAKESKQLGAGVMDIGAGLQAVKGVISTLADIVGYFKVDFDIKGQTINLSNTALQSLVAGRITSAEHSVFLPNFYRIPPSAPIKVLTDFNQCIINKDELKRAVTGLKELLIHPQVTSKKQGGTTAEKSLISEAEKACENAGKLIEGFAEFNKGLTTPPEGGGYSPLAAAALRQYLDIMGITHLLYLTVTSSGGEMVTGKGFFYWATGFLGGCIVTWALASCSGEILAADTSLGYSSVKYHLFRNKLSEFKHPEI